MVAAAEWHELLNRFYRKQELYTMCWKGVDLRRNLVAASRFGGPVALVRDERKVLLLRSEAIQPRLTIYTSSGLVLASFPWDRQGGKLAGIGWADDEILLCVMEDGTVYQYDVHGELLPSQLSLGRECWDQGVAECIIWGAGIVVLTAARQAGPPYITSASPLRLGLFAIPDLKQGRAVKLADPLLADTPFCMAVVEPQHWRSGRLEVLLAAGASVLVVDTDTVKEKAKDLGPIQAMAVSPNGAFVALFTHEGRLLVLSSDFSTSLSDIEMELVPPPDQLVWCGVDSVLLWWEEEQMLQMVGPSGDSVTFVQDEPGLALVPEVDGVRLLTSSAMEFLHRVPDSTVSIFRIGSTAPGALLFDALDHFDKRSAKADESLRSIGAALPEAVEACIDAAGHEFDIDVQRTLLRAAAYGRAFCSTFSKDRFQSMCKSLRILNAVRRFEIGVPLSYQQYEALTPKVLVARLANYHHHLLALRICSYLSLGSEEVLVHWACTKARMSSHLSDAALLQELADMLKPHARIPFATIAADVYRSGRPKLAAMLLDFEPRASEQVPLLTAMGEDEQALVKAMESGDADLVYFTIFHIRRTKPAAEFARIVNSKSMARDLFVAYAKHSEPETLKQFYAAVGQPQGKADLLMQESWAASKLLTRAVSGPAAQGPRLKLLEQARELYGQSKEHSEHAKAAEELARLLKRQMQLEASTGQAVFVNSSVSDTLRTLIAIGEDAMAQKLRHDFKIPDRRFFWLKARALAARRDWDALERFSREKKPYNGFRPFVEACIEEGAPAEAVKYIPKLADPHERAEAYARIGMQAEATEAAGQAKDGELLSRFKSFNQSLAASSLLDSLRDRLNLQSSGQPRSS
eukprot:SM000206S06243  [mRNA]  locus=s206:68260:73829:+ [translate_table: standard]